MNGHNMRLTRRGRLVRTALILVLVSLIWYVSGHVWYVGPGWCIGSLTSCMA